MIKMYVVVAGSTLEELINEVNEQMNINSGTPQGGMLHSEGILMQPMLIKIKTGNDKVLPEQIRLIDIKIVRVARMDQAADPFMQSMVIYYSYKGKEDKLAVDNYDSDDKLQSALKVQEYLQATLK